MNYDMVQQTIEGFIEEKIDEDYNGGLVGISGGIDSAVTANLARNAIVNRTSDSKLYTVTFKFNEQREEDFEDSKRVVRHLDIEKGHRVIDISEQLGSLRDLLEIKDLGSDEYLALFERLSSAITLGMAQKDNLAVISSSNKTEYLTSFFSIGGNIGHIFPLAGLFKTEVRELADHLGVPRELIYKTPSDGFATRRTDEEILGMDYRNLDQVCYQLEKGNSAEAVAKKTGINPALVTDVSARMQDLEKKFEFPTCEIYAANRLQPERTQSAYTTPRPTKSNYTGG